MIIFCVQQWMDYEGANGVSFASFNETEAKDWIKNLKDSYGYEIEEVNVNGTPPRTDDPWTDVNDQLPDLQERVLIFTDEDEIHVGHRSNGFWVIGGRFHFDIGNPVKWQPLPAKPDQ